MSNITEVENARDGKEFTLLEGITVISQSTPRYSKKNEPYTIATVGNKFSNVTMMSWGDPAEWKLPLDKELTLKGKFLKKTYQGKPCLDCHELTPPTDAVKFKADEFSDKVELPSIKGALDIGVKAADYMVTLEKPEYSEYAFKLAAEAHLQGIKMK